MILRLASTYRGIGLALAVVAGLAGTLPAAAQGQAPHHDIILTLDPAVGAVKVRDRIRISGHNDIALRLTRWMRTTDIRLDGQAASARFADGRITLTLPTAGPHQIDILAEGTIARDGAGDQSDPASVPFAGPDGIYLPGWVEWFPQTGDDSETFRLTIRDSFTGPTGTSFVIIETTSGTWLPSVAVLTCPWLSISTSSVLTTFTTLPCWS